MRFRVAGTNWEGRRWALVPSLRTLATQIDAAVPTGHAADGTVASKRHDQNNPGSDHRPRPTAGAGLVRALDFGEHAEEAFGMLEAIRLSKDDRVRYVIHERRMFSSYPKGTIAPYTWRPYSGSSGHLNHGHVSALEVNQNDSQPWDIGEGFNMAMQVIDIQKALNEADQPDAAGNPLAEDGDYGPKTAFALANGFRIIAGGTVDPVARGAAHRANDRLDNV